MPRNPQTRIERLTCVLLALLACCGVALFATPPRASHGAEKAAGAVTGRTLGTRAFASGGRGVLARGRYHRHDNAATAASRKPGWRGGPALSALLGSGPGGGDPDRTRLGGAANAHVPTLALLLARPSLARAGLPAARPSSFSPTSRVRAASAPFSPRDPTPTVLP